MKEQGFQSLARSLDRPHPTSPLFSSTEKASEQPRGQDSNAGSCQWQMAVVKGGGGGALARRHRFSSSYSYRIPECSVVGVVGVVGGRPHGEVPGRRAPPMWALSRQLQLHGLVTACDLRTCGRERS